MYEDVRIAGDLVKDYMSQYSSYVAQERALPQLVDGLKPVHRRILNSASDLHLYHDRAYLKTAKLEGQVLGDYHPHGGANVTTLIQPFNIRYPILEGKGNWGSPDDPYSVAASRYTEVKLTKFAEDFYLSSSDYADREPNYDGRLQEIVRYYPPVPGCLLTSAKGMAIGLTTSVPSHEIGMVCDSLLRYLRGQDCISGMYPDTCEKSITLSSAEEIRSLYERGSGSVRYRAATHYERVGKNYLLVVDAFPPGFSKKRLSTNSKILEYVDEGKLSLSNESSKDVRYVFTSQEKSILEDVLSVLESTVSYKMHIEHDGIIALYPLTEIYKDFCKSRKAYISRKYADLSDKYKVELEYNKALLAFKRSSLVREIILLSESEAVSRLVDRLKISEENAKRILSSPIRSLLKSNEDSILLKISTLESSIKEYAGYVEDPESKLILDIKAISKAYGGSTNTVLACLNSFREEGEVLSSEGLKRFDSLQEAVESSESYPYYLLSDSRGFIMITRDLLDHRYPEHILKTTEDPIIYGIYDPEKYQVDYIGGISYQLGGWCLRKRSSNIIYGNGFSGFSMIG